MKPFIHRLKLQQRAIERLAFELGVELAIHNRATLKVRLQEYADTVLGHLALEQEAIFPELVRFADARGLSRLAERSRAFVRDAEHIAHGLRTLLAPHQAQPLSLTKLEQDWPLLRSLVNTLIAEESAIYDLYDRAVEPPAVAENRRREPRVACEGTALVLSPQPAVGKVRDISRGGAYLQLPEPLPAVGTKLDVRLSLPGIPEPIEVRAEVRHHGALAWDLKEPGLGAQFLDVDPSAGRLIGAFVASASS